MPDWITKYWGQWLFGLVTAALAAGYRSLAKKVKHHSDESKSVKEGLLAILHDRLYQGCRYYLDKGSVDLAGLKNMEYLYNSYHALGGNGTGTELYNRVKGLPIKED